MNLVLFGTNSSIESYYDNLNAVIELVVLFLRLPICSASNVLSVARNKINCCPLVCYYLYSLSSGHGYGLNFAFCTREYIDLYRPFSS